MKYGYVAFYRNKRIEIELEDEQATTYNAQQIAARQFKAKRPSDVTVMLAEKDGQPVVHRADF